MTKRLKLPALHPAQQQVWAGRARYNVVCLGRRSGKTALGILLALGASACSDLATAALQGYPVGWFAPTYKVLDAAWRESKQRLKPVITCKSEQSKRLEIIGGGAIDFWSLEDEDAGRGRKYSRVIIDEAGIAKRLQPAWENAIRPTLTDFGGDAWFLSTPKGRNYFYDCYQRGINQERNWASWQMPTACNPFIHPDEIEEARRNLPERTFQQEYLAQFLDDAGGVFRNILACTYEIPSDDWWRKEQKQADGRAYVIGVDLARVEDFTVITVVDARDRKVVAVDRFNQVEYVMQLERLAAMAQRFKGAPILIESNNTGLPFIEQAKRRGLPVRAFQTTNASKAEIIEKLAIAFEQGTISIPDYPPLINELMCFDQERLPSGMIRYGAPSGQHDDTVMSLAIAFYGATGIAQSAPDYFRCKDLLMATTPKALYNEQAIDYLLNNLLQMADTDETLKKLGIHRKELRTLESDDEIYAAIETRREALIATPWRLETGLVRQNNFLWTEIERVIATVLRGAFNAVLYGYSVQEVIYKNTDGKITIAEVSEKPFEWFEPKSNGDLIYRSMQDPMGEIVDTQFKFLLTVRNQTYRQPYGEAILSRLYWAWLFRVNGWKFWAKNLERAGIPFLKGTAPDMPMADGSPSVDHLSVVLNAAVQNATLALPAGWEAEFMSVQQNGATFEQFENAILKRIQKIILGQTLTSDVGKAGSFAAAKVHQSVLDDRRKADMRLVTKTVQTLVTALHTLNGFTGEPPTFVMEDDTGLEVERADRDSKLVQAGVLKLTPDYLLRVYDYEDGDFEIPPNPPMGGNQVQKLPMGNSAKSANFSASSIKFTPQQQKIESLADDVLKNSASPIPEGTIFNAIRAAKSPEDLTDRLAVLFKNSDMSEFSTILERALFAADVMGYAHA